MINEDILVECFRRSSSSHDLRISPLTWEYVRPRQSLLIPARYVPSSPPKWLVRPHLELLLLGLKTNKKIRENRSLVIPCFIIQGNACFGHTDLFTVTSVVDPYAYGLHVSVFGPNEGAYSQGTITTIPRAQVLTCWVQSEDDAPQQYAASQSQRPQHNLSSVSNYELFNSSSINIRYWCWNYRGCWHQTCPPMEFTDRFRYHPLQLHTTVVVEVTISLRCLSSVAIGQFARLLPSLDVVAVSQAPSPESNPNSPLPVNATVVHYTTVKADRADALAGLHLSKECAITRLTCFIHSPLLLPALIFVSVNCSRLSPDWSPAPGGT